MKCTYENCEGYLRHESADVRQEWVDEVYVCTECGKEFVLTTIYKQQSSIVKSQTLYNEEGEEVG